MALKLSPLTIVVLSPVAVRGFLSVNGEGFSSSFMDLPESQTLFNTKQKNYHTIQVLSIQDISLLFVNVSKDNNIGTLAHQVYKLLESESVKKVVIVSSSHSLPEPLPKDRPFLHFFEHGNTILSKKDNLLSLPGQTTLNEPLTNALFHLLRVSGVDTTVLVQYSESQIKAELQLASSIVDQVSALFSLPLKVANVVYDSLILNSNSFVQRDVIESLYV